MKKTFLILIIFALFIFGSFSVFAKTKEQKSALKDRSIKTSLIKNSSAKNNNKQNKIEIVDYVQRKVVLDKPAEKIVVMADNCFMVVKQLGAENKIVGLDSKTKGYWDLYLVSKTNPELANLPDVGKTKNPNYEYIISLEPDLILFKGNKEAANTLEEKTRIPVAVVNSKSGFDFEIYNVIGLLLGKEKEAKKIIDELSSRKEIIEEKLANVSRKSAYIVVQNAKNTPFRTQIDSVSLELAAITNVLQTNIAGKVDEWGFAEISREEFINMNPDFIFIDYPTSSMSISKQSIKTNDAFNFCNALENNDIYYTHSFSAPKDYAYVIAEAYYYANIAYPEIITEDIYKEAINSIFEKTYSVKNYYEDFQDSLN